MPDDRFADLGSGKRAGDRLAELDEHQPEERREPPRRRGRYTWVVGVAAVMAIAVAGLNSLPNPGRGADGPPVGKPLPRFAAPDARGDTDLDPNTNQSRTDPRPGDTPACEVRVTDAIRSCDYTDKPLVLTFIAPTAECVRFVDRVERLRPRFPAVNFLTVVSAADREKAGALAREHSWDHPVVVDRNGDVLNLNGISFCATVVFAYEGGDVRATKATAQDWSDEQLSAAIRATERR